MMVRPPDRSGKTGSEELARLVRERREELGLSRQDLADATGIPYPTIAQIETAYRGVSPARLGVIARALGLDPKRLYEVLAAEGPAAQSGPPKVRSPAAGARPAPGGPGGWHANPRFAAPVAAAPASAASSAAAHAAAAPVDPDSDRPDPAAGVVDRVVDLLSGLPADQRIEALGQVQGRMLERLVAERTSRAEQESDR